MITTCPRCRAWLGFEHIDRDGIRRDYSRVLGVEVSEIYDGILYWQCPDCGHAWPAFPEGHRRHAIALEVIAESLAADPPVDVPEVAS